jgi:peptidoglycan/xylan/chitin deacetylase (PgdA/CDA1 family)
MEFESHTLSHARLKTLQPDALTREVTESKRILEERLNRPVLALAYPDGGYNDTVIAAIKRAGYETAVGIASGFRQRPEDLFALHRIRVSYRDTIQDLAARLP